MRLLKPVLAIFFLCPWSVVLSAQDRTVPKFIRAKGEYVHVPSQTVFPEYVEALKRASIHVFDDQGKDVGVTYRRGQMGRRTTLSIFIFPAGAGREGRLREEYLNSVYALSYGMTLRSGSGEYGPAFEQKPVRYEGERYICNGFRAMHYGDIGCSAMSLYECGTWFLRIRVTSEQADTAGAARLERLAVAAFDPSRLTALDPLTVVDTHIAPAAYQDSTLLACTKASAMGKLRWPYEIIPERERASGFPDLYLQLHIRTWEAFVQAGKSVPDTPDAQTDFTVRYLRDWQSLIESGYLAEFLMDRYRMVMIVPENLELDMDGYFRWQADHPVEIDLNRKYSMIVYRPEEE